MGEYVPVTQQSLSGFYIQITIFMMHDISKYCYFLHHGTYSTEGYHYSKICCPIISNIFC